MKPKQKRQTERQSNGGMRQIICEERERQGNKDSESMPKEKGMRKSVLLGLILREPMRWVTGEEGWEIRAKED